MQIEKIFPTDPDLEIREELISIHAINPFVAHDSSARSHMASSHISQILTINHAEEKIIQSGLEKQFGENTFSAKSLADVRVLKVIYRYKGVSANTVNAITQALLIVENIETGELDYIDVPNHFSLHQYFGFKYVWNEDVLNSISPGTILPANTILADSPNVRKNNGYAFGLNANVLLATEREASEDGVVISESFAEKLSYTIFEKRVVNFGTNNFPLNIYGDENNYKAFPEIGDTIGEDSVVMVLRDYDPELSPALTSKKDVMTFNPIFDTAVFVKGPGKEEIKDGYEVKSGVVVDIVAYHSPKFKKEIYTDTSDMVMKYVDGYKQFQTELIETFEKLEREHYNRYKNNDMKVSPKLHRMLIDAYAIVNPDSNKIAYSFRNEPLDIIRMEFTIEYKVVPKTGNKLSDLHGFVL